MDGKALVAVGALIGVIIVQQRRIGQLKDMVVHLGRGSDDDVECEYRGLKILRAWCEWYHRRPYVMVLDHFPGIDRLKTSLLHGVPNFRRTKSALPIYGMAQPTATGLRRVTKHLMDSGHSCVVSINLREEPIVFVKLGSNEALEKTLQNNLVSYSPRSPSNLIHNVTHPGDTAADLAVAERTLKGNLIRSSTSRDGTWPFFHNVTDLSKEPKFFDVDFVSC